ncbi:electron transport complex subunit RsxB [Methanobrevibacter cuticularis]|uniref:Electron transport complex subunit RsxB n=1 Tax=Methanobrevibacter cuticularis TaxID=47311 RepID=A0A166CXB9_9EURY|nr:electron transport complex subunit RsxB [Methanobrevibacter cuticularis]
MIKVDPNLCKGCDLCIETCPEHVYDKSSKLNKKGVYLPCPKREKDCTKCHLCELMCPDQAISVTEDEEDDQVDNINDDEKSDQTDNATDEKTLKETTDV